MTRNHRTTEIRRPGDQRPSFHCLLSMYSWLEHLSSLWHFYNVDSRRLPSSQTDLRSMTAAAEKCRQMTAHDCQQWLSCVCTEESLSTTVWQHQTYSFLKDTSHILSNVWWVALKLATHRKCGSVNSPAYKSRLTNISRVPCKNHLPYVTKMVKIRFYARMIKSTMFYHLNKHLCTQYIEKCWICTILPFLYKSAKRRLSVQKPSMCK